MFRQRGNKSGASLRYTGCLAGPHSLIFERIAGLQNTQARTSYLKHAKPTPTLQGVACQYSRIRGQIVFGRCYVMPAQSSLCDRGSSCVATGSYARLLSTDPQQPVSGMFVSCCQLRRSAYVFALSGHRAFTGKLTTPIHQSTQICAGPAVTSPQHLLNTPMQLERSSSAKLLEELMDLLKTRDGKEYSQAHQPALPLPVPIPVVTSDSEHELGTAMQLHSQRSMGSLHSVTEHPEAKLEPGGSSSSSSSAIFDSPSSPHQYVYVAQATTC